MSDLLRKTHRPLSEAEQAQVHAIKVKAQELYDILNNCTPPQSRELSLARTKIEEAVMWAVKHVTG